MPTRIRQAVITATGIMLLAVFSGCASGPTIITNAAPSFVPANYQTFGFLQPLSTDQGEVRTMISTFLIDATTKEMEMAGFRRSDTNPDLIVNFVVSTRETLSTRPSSSASIHHSRGRYSTWSGYSWGMSTTEVVQRTEGTLGVDMIDPASMTLVWEGAARGRVTDAVRRDLQPAIDRAIVDIFKEFP